MARKSVIALLFCCSFFVFGHVKALQLTQTPSPTLTLPEPTEAPAPLRSISGFTEVITGKWCDSAHNTGESGQDTLQHCFTQCTVSQDCKYVSFDDSRNWCTRFSDCGEMADAPGAVTYIKGSLTTKSTNWSPYTRWDMCNKSMLNNLGGMGPDKNFKTKKGVKKPNVQELRIQNVAILADEQYKREFSLDLLITNVTEYVRMRKQDDNGLYGCMGMVAVAASMNTTLNFRLVNSGTSKPAKLKMPWFFTIYDVDQNVDENGTADGLEMITVHGGESYCGVPANELSFTGSMATNDLTFTSTMFGVNADNPTDTYHLSDLQKLRTVTMNMGLESDFNMTFTVIGGNRGRPFLFGGRSQVVDDGDCLPTTTTTTGCAQSEGGCSIFEDPHVVVFDGARISLLETATRIKSRHDDAFASDGRTQARAVGVFEGQRKAKSVVNGGDASGDMWLVKSALISIQARYLPDANHPESLFMRHLAVGGAFMNGHTLIVGPLNDKVTWDGAEILAMQHSVFHVKGLVDAVRSNASCLVEDLKSTSPGIDIALPQDVKLIINRQPEYINVHIAMPPAKGGQDGLCGNNNGDAVDDSMKLIIEDRSPKVLISDSLFPFPVDAAESVVEAFSKLLMGSR